MPHRKIRAVKERIEERRRRNELKRQQREARIDRESADPGAVEDLSVREHAALTRRELADLADELNVSPRRALEVVRNAGEEGSGLAGDAVRGARTVGRAAASAGEALGEVGEAVSEGVDEDPLAGSDGGERRRRRVERAEREQIDEMEAAEQSVDDILFGGGGGDAGGEGSIDDVLPSEDDFKL